MSKSPQSGKRVGWVPLVVVLTLVVLAVLGNPTAADDPLTELVVKVEEDWKLVVKEPSKSLASPQVSTQMARHPWTSRVCNFHLNACDVPTISQGGLQLQVWQDSTNLAVLTSSSRAVMDTPNEEVAWTQYLRIDEGKVKFGISKASSQTWGDFSGAEVTIPTGGTSLDWYNPQYSQAN